MNTQGLGVDDNLSQPKEVSAIRTEWTDDEQFVDTDPDEAYMSPPSRTVAEKPLLVAESTQGRVSNAFYRYAYPTWGRGYIRLGS
jgi:hypothetical protein